MDIVLDGSTLTVKTASATETEALGCSLGALLEAGDVLALVGELGAGKRVLPGEWLLPPVSVLRFRW